MTQQGFVVIEADGTERIIWLAGRVAWAMNRLIGAGILGITSLSDPAPRLSHYVHVLRREHGVQIETIEERHGGLYRGWHGRYVLRSLVRRLTSLPPVNFSTLEVAP